MLHAVLYLFIFIFEVMGVPDNYRQKLIDKYRVETRKNFTEGHVCNFEAYHLHGLEFVLYTCVHEDKCRGVKQKLYLRRPELKFDNCKYAFFPPKEGGSYICCHPEDNEDSAGIIDPSKVKDLKFMPGFRSAFKCVDNGRYVCLDAQHCPENEKRERKGGKETSIGKYPHLALIGSYSEDTFEQDWFCLGSIIASHFVLSAASCESLVTRKKPTTVRVGFQLQCELNKNCREDDKNQVMPIKKLIKHPKYNEKYYYHDIMLIQVEFEFWFNSHVRPVCLYTIMNTTVGSGMFTEYEDRGTKSKSSMSIHEMEIQEFHTQMCNLWFAYDSRIIEGLYEIDGAIMTCAGLPQKAATPCWYDFGGPLQVYEDVPFCMFHVYGVMAYSNRVACRSDRVAIFTKVSFYLDWIEGIVWEHFNMLNEYDTFREECKTPIQSGLARTEGRCKPN